MKTKRTIRIELEREREVVIRQRESREVWCPACGAQVPFETRANENETGIDSSAPEEPDVYSPGEKIER